MEKATITAVHKNGSTNLFSNYRPISITCVCCKILERILVKRIQEHLAANNILHPEAVLGIFDWVGQF